MFGVPVISPVAVSKLSPFENDGLIAHEPATPPELEGEIVLIAKSFGKGKIVLGVRYYRWVECEL